MAGLKIVDKGSLGIQIDVPYTTTLGTPRAIHVTVAESGINVAATSDLNADGYLALKQALAVAEIIQARGFAG